MAIALYNPKYLVGGDGKRMLNTTDVKRFVWSHAYWDLKAGEIKKFPDDVAKGMMKNIDFIVEVTPKNIKEIKEELVDKRFKCEYCPFQTDTKVAFISHVSGKHGATEEQLKEIEGIEEAAPRARFQGVGRPPTAEEIEDLPDTSQGDVTDRDGVKWVGEGVQKDSI